MKPIPISLQLYSLREDAAHDFPGVLARVADMGYVGVEFAGLHGMPPAEVRAVLDDVGLVASSTHGPLPTADNVEEIVETARVLGYTRHIAGFGPQQFETREKTLEAAEKAQRAAELLQPHGLTFGLHNHWWEFSTRIDGRYAHELLMEAAPGVFAEIDTYWVKVGGADPAAVVRRYGARAPLLHIKDGPGVREAAMAAIGTGVMDWQAVVGAAGEYTEWLIVELDRCDSDMAEAVAASCRYLVSNGFARGRA
ncbi:MAG: sugar phosphate isomerase/epimerase [Kiritimatiellaeota bacterium]|nr:sugar phosphate isomerase/epimerase [Kiritimatiellota bacterium]